MERTESQNAVGCLCHEHFLFLQGFSLKRKKITLDHLLQEISKGVFLENYVKPMLKVSESKVLLCTYGEGLGRATGSRLVLLRHCQQQKLTQ